MPEVRTVEITEEENWKLVNELQFAKAGDEATIETSRGNQLKIIICKEKRV